MKEKYLALSELNPVKLMDHLGHELRSAVWADEYKIWNVALVCEDCQEVLADWDASVTSA